MEHNCQAIFHSVKIRFRRYVVCFIAVMFAFFVVPCTCLGGTLFPLANGKHWRVSNNYPKSILQNTRTIMFLKGILNATFTFTVKLPEAVLSFSFTRNVSRQSEEQRKRFKSENLQTRSIYRRTTKDKDKSSPRIEANLCGIKQIK